MPTKSEVIYQRALQFKQLVSEISIKHYADDPAIYPTIVEGIFREVFRDEIDGEDILCSDSSPCEYQTDEDGEPLADEVSGKESIVIEDDSVRGES